MGRGRTTLSVSAHVIALAVLATGAAAGEDWPQFRGAASDGVALASGSSVLSDPGVGLRLAWKKPLGSGYSGVAVAQGRAVTMFSDGTSDVMAAFDAGTGRELWRFEIEPTYTGHDGSHDGPIATPVIAGDRAVGLSARGRLFAVEVATGKLLWSTDLVADHGAKKPFYGFATSPILEAGLVVLQLGAENGSVAGFDPATGERRWMVGADTVAYQSPVPVVLDGRRVVLAGGMKQLVAVDPARGELLWEYEHEGDGPRGIASLVPVPAGQGRVFLAYRDDSSAAFALDRRDADGKIAPERLWDSRTIRNSYAVPVYHDGYVYAFSTRFLTCVDVATGEAAWRSREPGDGFLIRVGDLLVVLTKDGSLHLAPATPDGWQPRAELAVFEDLAWSPPGFAGGSIYARSHGEIARIDLVSAKILADGAAASPGTAPGSAAPGAGDSAFARFLAEVAAAEDEARAKIVDRFMASVKSFPLIEGDRVHFIYRGPGNDLAIGGDMIGARQERPMTRVPGTDLHYYTARLGPGARVNYILFRDYEALPDPLNPRPLVPSPYEKDMEVGEDTIEMSWVATPGWSPPGFLGEPTADAPAGRLVSRVLESAALEKSHTVGIYLPPGYDERADRRYPVVYVHGGEQAKTRGDWGRVLDRIVGQTAAPLIVVFIHEPFRPFGPAAAKYTTMFADELIPFVDEHYRTVAAPDGRASVGQGFNAYGALMCVLAKPGAVGKVGTQSVYMLDTMWKGLEPMIRTSEEQPLEIYHEWGSYDLRNPHEAWDMIETNRMLAHLLREKGYAPSGGEVPDGAGWASWRNRTDRLLGGLFPAR